MAYQLPPDLDAIAKKIKPEIYKTLSAAQKLARVMESQRLLREGLAISDPQLARHYLNKSQAVLNAMDPDFLASEVGDYRRKALETNDSTLRDGYNALARQLLEENPQPVQATCRAADKAVAAELAKTAKPAVRNAPVRKTAGAGHVIQTRPGHYVRSEEGEMILTKMLVGDRVGIVRYEP